MIQGWNSPASLEESSSWNKALYTLYKASDCGSNNRTLKKVGETVKYKDFVTKYDELTITDLIILSSINLVLRKER